MQQIYLDYNATTPLAPQVQEAMLPFLADQFGNPSSKHSLGQAARAAIDDARVRVAQFISAKTSELFFTSGGTESNNLAIVGAAWAHIQSGHLPGHLVTSAIEHPAIVAPIELLKAQGWTVTVVGCDSQGVINPQDIADAIQPDTLLVSVMHSNNETGVLQPIEKIAELCRARGVLMHTDAAQSCAKIPVNVEELGCDLLSIAGHKLYAPKGVGALYIRTGTKIEPVLRGAGQELGIKPGTENVLGIVGLGAAAERATNSLSESSSHLAEMRDRLQDALIEGTGGSASKLIIFSNEVERLPNTLAVSFPGIAGEDLLAATAEVYASTGSACHDGLGVPSTTLSAMGVDLEIARGAIRLSLGHFTTEEEIDRAASLLLDAWERNASC